MRSNRPVAILIGALALAGVLVLSVYALAVDQLDGKQEGSKGKAEPSTQERNTTPPNDKTLWLTVPGMKRINDAEIPTGLITDRALLRDYAGVHIEGTGWPWENGANVYIAGQRLGYPKSDSWLAFWDLDKLQEGDKVYITDSELRKYTYVVYEKSVRKGSSCRGRTDNTFPDLEPVEGKSVVTLQTCTLPNFENHLLVRGELKKVSEG
jgi:sortase A